MIDKAIEKEISAFNQKIEASINSAKKTLKEKKVRDLVCYDNYLIAKLKESIAKVLSVKLDDIELRIPPNHIEGDFALEMFGISKARKINPKDVAKDAADKLNQAGGYIETAKTAGPFVNINLNRGVYYKEVLNEIQKLNREYGFNDANKKKVAVIDYAGPNVAKPFGVGHLRSTIIGDALKNIYEATGYSVIGDNHIGDWGTQFGKLLYAYMNWADKGKIQKNPIEELKNIYVEFNDRAEKKPELNDKARELFQKLESGDPEMTAYWIEFVKLSIESFNKVFKRIGVKFDITIGESFFKDEANELTDECIKKGVAKIDKESGAVIVENLNNLPTFLLKKSDGTTLYMSRDLATMIFRINEFKPNDIIYVVGSEQELSFKQLFALAKLMGYLPENVNARHIGFGMLLVDGVKMSTRKGTLVALEELMDKSIQKSKEILKEKNPDIENKELEDISEAVGVGAIIYNDLRQGRTKNISFDWERMLDYESGSAVYLQYTYARIKSIIKKAGEKTKVKDYSLKTDIEFKLAKKLSVYPDIINRAQASDSPHVICNYLEELTQVFNSFYNEVSIIKIEEKDLMISRLALIEAVAIVIQNGLNLINIKTPERI